MEAVLGGTERITQKLLNGILLDDAADGHKRRKHGR
jgi:hypothetical protein